MFNYTAHDADGNTVNGTITINVKDDVPTAHADTNSVGEGGSVNGNVLTDGVDDVFGADGKVVPSGGVTGVATGSNTAAPVSGNVGSNLTGTYGTLHLNADGTYTYTANPNSVTSNQVDHFVYTITDGDGDTSTVTLDITVNNVNLPADNQTKTVDEAALAIGSNPSSTAETVGGTLAVAGATGYTPAVIVGTHGTLTLNANGTYSYTLTSPVDGTTANNGTNTVNGVEVFNYTAHDAGGNTVNGTITINVIDDVPTAHNDTDSVKEDGPLVADGNVLTGSGGSDANATDGVADTQGADGATVTGVKLPAGASYGAVATDVAGTQIVGAHGTLTIHADGSYSYALNNADPAVQALGATQSTTDTFNYQLTDGDGDLSNANLVITINGTNDAPVVGNSTANVSEEGLTGGNPDTTGTPDTTNAVIANGTITITDVDTSDSHTVTLTAPATALMSGAFNVIWTGSGTNTLHAYADVDGSGTFTAGDTPVMTITIDNAGAYTVTLQGAINHADATIEDLKSFGVTVNVNDGTTTSTGTLTVNVEDDSPKNFSPQDMNDKTGATATTSDDALVNDGTAVATNPINDTNNDHVGENFIGADGFGSLLFTATGHTNGEALKSTGGTALTSHGDAILLSGFGTTTLTAYTESGLHAGYQVGEDHIVFTATLNAGAGNGSNSTYTIDFDDTIDDGSGIVLSDFSTAPAGQNQWIGLDSDLNDIAVDNNNSPDLLLTGTNGGTVNTSSSDIGSNNQWIDQNEGIRIDFVTDVNRDGANDEKDTQGYTFDGHYVVNGTSFTIMQEQGSGGGAAVRISAFNDPDSGNIHTLGGSIVPIDITSIVVTGDATYTIVNMGDGTFVITGLAAGANVSFDTGGVDYNAISITNAAGVLNPATPSTTDTFSGQSFAIGEFGYFTAAAGSPIDMSFGVTGTDRDGDTATGTIDVSLVPAGSASSLAANTLMATNSIQSSDSADTNHLVSTNDNHRSFDHRMFEDVRGGNVATLAGAIAGAGLVAQPLAAHSLHGHEAFSGTHSAPLMAHGPLGSSQVAARGADHSVAGPSGHGAVATNEAGISHVSAPSEAVAHSLTGHTSAPQMHGTPLLGGTDAHVAAHSAAFTSAAVSMPSAQMLAAHAAANGGKSVDGDAHASVAGAQQNAVGQVIADALAGGHGHGSIDTLLHNATGAHGHAGADALAALASHSAPDVSFLHGGMAAGFASAHGAPLMHQIMMHQDVAPAHN